MAQAPDKAEGVEALRIDEETRRLRALIYLLKRDFASVKHVKPAASRQDSSERYVLAMGFRGVQGRPLS